MGCDIHLFWECPGEPGGKYITVGRVYLERWSELFGLMGNGNIKLPYGLEGYRREARGIPPNLGHETGIAEWDNRERYPYHHASWLTKGEFEELYAEWSGPIDPVLLRLLEGMEYEDRLVYWFDN